MTTTNTPETLVVSRLSGRQLMIGILVLLAAVMAGLTIGPVDIAPHRVVLELLNGLPGVEIESGLSEIHQGIIEKIRLPRVVLGVLVGATLSLSGAAYQGAFRNPLADPYLLGIAAGAGLGATIAITSNLGDGAGIFDPVPLAAFAGALIGVGASYMAGHIGGRSTASLVLAGVAVASFLTACQTYVLQANSESFREVYGWILGRIATSGWSEPVLMLPYFLLTMVVVLRHRRQDRSVCAVVQHEAARLCRRRQRAPHRDTHGVVHADWHLARGAAHPKTPTPAASRVIGIGVVSPGHRGHGGHQRHWKHSRSAIAG